MRKHRWKIKFFSAGELRERKYDPEMWGGLKGYTLDPAHFGDFEKHRKKETGELCIKVEESQ